MLIIFTKEARNESPDDISKAKPKYIQLESADDKDAV